MTSHVRRNEVTDLGQLGHPRRCEEPDPKWRYA